MKKPTFAGADVAVEQYKACSQDYDKLEWDCSRVKHVQFLKTWEELQTRFLTLQARVEEDRTEKPLSTTTANKFTSADSSSSKHRVDKLPLPTFEGDIASWRSFWRRFTSSVKGDFTDDEKLEYLQNALKDSTAKEIVQESIRNGDDYYTVSLHLQRRVDRPRDVFLGALRSISEIGTLDYDRKGLAGLESEVRKAVNTLKRYGDGSMDQILTAFLELKMTAKFRQE